MTCIQQDFRWDRVDERNVYLARLVRDLELPTAQIVTQLFAHPEDADGYPFETRHGAFFRYPGEATRVGGPCRSPGDGR